MHKFIPNSGENLEKLVGLTGYKDREDLLSMIPKKYRLDGDLNIPSPASEITLRRYFSRLASKNQADSRKNFAGAGYYSHYVPSIIDAISSRGEFLTSYTPYQPEVSQGTLQAIFEYQSWICKVTGMEVSNASMYDGSTALTEAILMAGRVKRNKNKVMILGDLHPEYREVMDTYLAESEFEIHNIKSEKETGTVDLAKLEDHFKAHGSEYASVAIQNPSFMGVIEDLEAISKLVRAHTDSLFILAVAEPHSLSLFKKPGELDFDVVCGEGTSFGTAPNFSGPGFGFFASKQAHVRQLPGRICGKSIDSDGNEAFCLTLSTREQHIRRERATSNICTNQGLFATRAAMYFSTMGRAGLREVAVNSHSLAKYAKGKFEDAGINLFFRGEFFNEFVIRVDDLDSKFKACLDAGVLPGVRLSDLEKDADENLLLVCFTELNDWESIDELVQLLSRGGAK
jgi:glycine dehydrogenase subunit 1